MENKTDFFTRISPLLTGGLNLTITLKRVGDQITVATRPQRPDVKDKNDVLSKIQPLVITESAEALDEGYIDTITQAAEPVNSIADGLKEFNKGVEAAKKASTSKKPKAAPKAKSSNTPGTKTRDRKAKASKSKLSPEEAAAKKQKEADAKKASEVKQLALKVTSANGALTANKFSAAEQAIAGGLKLWKAKKHVPAETDEDFGRIFTELSDRVKQARADKERGENMKKAAKPMADARKLFKSMNLPEAAKNLKAAYKLVPDHPDAIALTKEVIEQYNETVYNQLMEK